MGVLFPGFAQLCLARARLPASLLSIAAPQPSAGNSERTRYGATLDCATLAYSEPGLPKIGSVIPKC